MNLNFIQEFGLRLGRYPSAVLALRRNDATLFLSGNKEDDIISRLFLMKSGSAVPSFLNETDNSM